MVVVKDPRKPRICAWTPWTVSLALAVILFSAPLAAQEPDRSFDKAFQTEARAAGAYLAGDYDAAAALFEKAVRDPQANVELWKYLGYACAGAAFESGRPLQNEKRTKWNREVEKLAERALEGMQTYIEKGGRDPRRFDFLCELFDMPINDERAGKLLPKLVKKHPEETAYWKALATHHDRNRRVTQAFDAATEWRQRAPDPVPPVLRLTRLFIRQCLLAERLRPDHVDLIEPYIRALEYIRETDPCAPQTSGLLLQLRVLLAMAKRDEKSLAEHRKLLGEFDERSLPKGPVGEGSGEDGCPLPPGWDGSYVEYLPLWPPVCLYPLGLHPPPSGSEAALPPSAVEIIARGGLKPPRVLYQVKPLFPHLVMNAGKQGKVVAEMILDENGRVEDVRILESTDPMFDLPVMDALRHWRFTRPCTEDGKPITGPVRIFHVVTVRFKF